MRGGLRLTVCAAMLGLGLAGCNKEPTFDERFAEQQKKLASEAAKTERELDRRMAEKPGMEAPSATPAPAST